MVNQCNSCFMSEYVPNNLTTMTKKRPPHRTPLSNNNRFKFCVTPMLTSIKAGSSTVSHLTKAINGRIESAETGHHAGIHQSRTAHRARRNTCKLSQPMDATVQHCPATVPAVTGIDRPKLGQRRSSGHTVHTTDEARTALRLSKLRSIKILYTLTMIYDSLYI